MDVYKLKEALDTIGLPLAYSKFNEPQELPYIAYREVDADTFTADNNVLVELQVYDIELYSIEKDLIHEREIRNLLSELELPYDKNSNYIESEKMYQTVYTVVLFDY